VRNKAIVLILVGVLAAAIKASPVDIMAGARGYGLGGAYTAIATDPSAAYWNPAGLAMIPRISIMESNWVLQEVTGLNINYVSVALPVEHVGTISGSWLAMFASLEQMGAGGETETNLAGEHTFSLSIGRRLWEKLLAFENTSLGITINRHTIQTPAANGAGLGFDIGFMTSFPYGIHLGIVGRSIGTDIMGDKINPQVRFGLGWSEVFQDMHKVTIAVTLRISKIVITSISKHLNRLRIV